MQQSKMFLAKDFPLDASEQIQLIIDKPQNNPSISNTKANKRPVKEIEFIHDTTDSDSLALFVSISKPYIQSLITHKAKAVSEEDKEKYSIGRQILIFKNDFRSDNFSYSFLIYEIEEDSVIFEVKIHLRNTDMQAAYSVWRLHYRQGISWKNEFQRQIDKYTSDIENNIQWKLSRFNDYLEKGDVFLEFCVTYKDLESHTNPLFLCGLTNIGNTCYMNSFLQTLYYIKILRKLVIEKKFKEDQQFGRNLQRVFSNLIIEDESAVDPTPIIEVGPWSRDFEFVQKDIHQFKMAFFEELEKLEPEVLELFRGEVLSSVYCKDVDYNSKTSIKIDEIDLFLANANRKQIRTIEDSLRYLTNEELLDGRIDAEPHGLQQAYKKLSFVKLPKILFFNLKRYEFDMNGLHKLFSRFQYQQQINLDYLVSDGEPHIYTLYSVLVHRGKTTEQGHYYSYINISTDALSRNWYIFNDSSVQKVSSRQVFQNNFGGVDNKYKFSKIDQSFQKSYDNKTTTAYILVYIENKYFEEIQNVGDIQVPKEIIEQEEIRKTNEKNRKMIVVSVLTTMQLEKQKHSIFNVNKIKEAGKEVMLNPDLSLIDQLNDIARIFFNGEAGYTAWKIGSNRTVYNLKKMYNDAYYPLDLVLLGHQRKSVQDFYILLIPNHFKCFQSNVSQKKKHFEITDFDQISSNQQYTKLSNADQLGLVVEYLAWTNQDQYVSSIESVKVIRKSSTPKIQQYVSKEYENVSVFQMYGRVIEYDDIVFIGRNIYCEIVMSYFEIKDEFYDFLNILDDDIDTNSREAGERDSRMEVEDDPIA